MCVDGLDLLCVCCIVGGGSRPSWSSEEEATEGSFAGSFEMARFRLSSLRSPVPFRTIE